MKRLLALILCLLLTFGLVACGETEVPTDSAAGADSSADANASQGGNDSSDKNDEQGEFQIWDDDMEHKFLATDITNHSVVVFDLNACEGDFELLKNDSMRGIVVWEWDSDDDPNCKIKPGAGLDSAKFRYSPYYKKDVIIACSSSGWAGVIDYEEKSLLWEYQVGEGPHSIEMLPNGDVVVACSSDPGKLAYVPLSAGITKPTTSIPSLWCHGVSWDPDLECLWVLEDVGVYQVLISNMGKENAKLSRINGSGATFTNSNKGKEEEAGGHALSPIYGEPGKYWVSSARYMWIFDSETETLTRNYPRATTLTAKTNIKGIASFPDGTVVETISSMTENTTHDWSCDGFRVIIRKLSEGKVKKVVDESVDIVFDTDHREFYKVQPFTKDYR